MEKRTMDRKAFIILSFIMFLTMTGYGIVLPSLPYVAERLGLSSFQMGSLITGWALAQFISTPVWGRLIDRFGRKPILFIGLFGFGIAFILIIFAQTYGQLLVARIIGATLSAGSLPAALTIVADSSDDENRGNAMAKIGAVNGLGFLCGPALGGVFAPLGVNAPFIAAGSLAFLALPFVWLSIKEPPKQVLKMAEPSFIRSLVLVTKSGYRELYILTLGISLAASSLFGMLGYFMIDGFSATPGEVSMAFSIFAGGSAFVQFFLLKYLYQIRTENWIAKFGFVICAIGYLLIAASINVWMAVLGCGLVGVGSACTRPTIISLLSKQERMGRGITMGLDQAIDSFGRILGPLIGGVFFALHSTVPFLGSSLICGLLFLVVLINGRDSFGVWRMEKEIKESKSQ
ncbi:MFS transporter [Bacillus sp. CECT 9360]|uniref:MFS transporter n=1 Tax=Bacillus sp. CECT 9360 TaxID=2845821 RepID=UPI0025B640FA|nr:MFS transporter [Bacillus sp. CECT 9360]